MGDFFGGGRQLDFDLFKHGVWKIPETRRSATGK
jgi:hypothetical protein